MASQMDGSGTGSSLGARNPSLCAFARIFLKGGEERDVEIPLPESAFQVVSEDGERVFHKGRFRFCVGFSQPDERSRELTGETPIEVIWNPRQ